MHELSVPGFEQVRLLLKDESAHPSGSLKHRLARSHLLYALCNDRSAPARNAAALLELAQCP